MPDKEINTREFRAWDSCQKKMYSWNELMEIDANGHLCLWNCMIGEVDHIKLMQFTGLKDKSGKKYFLGDKGRFDNGDTFVLRMEDWLEVYVDWIGDPECEDQARDLYRISRAEIIGNIYQGVDDEKD